MRRRRLLACCGLLAGSSLAGCPSGNGDSGGNDGDPGSVYRSTFRESLTDAGMSVRDLTIEDGRLQVVYSPGKLPEDGDESAYEARVEETVQIASRSFFDRVYGGWEVEGLDATVRIDGAVVATWRMEQAWVNRYLDGELEREEMTRRVAESVQRYDGTEETAAEGTATGDTAAGGTAAEGRAAEATAIDGRSG